nr:MAG TPA: hypothetical protein [Caudoviricetes sp.]
MLYPRFIVSYGRHTSSTVMCSYDHTSSQRFK